jgi:hypothetical protein
MEQTPTRSTNRIAYVLAPLLACTAACAAGRTAPNTAADDDDYDWHLAAGANAQSLGIERWVLRGAGSSAAVTGFGGQDKIVAHAVYSEDEHGTETAVFDLPAAWRVTTPVGQAPKADSEAPASIATAVDGMTEDLVTAMDRGSLGTRALQMGLRPTEETPSWITNSQEELLYLCPTTMSTADVRRAIAMARPYLETCQALANSYGMTSAGDAQCGKLQQRILACQALLQDPNQRV